MAKIVVVVVVVFVVVVVVVVVVSKTVLLNITLPKNKVWTGKRWISN